MSKPFDDMLAPFRETMRQFNENLKTATRKLAEAIDASMEQFRQHLEPTVDKLAELGWVIPMSAAPQEVVALAKVKDDERAIEEYFINNYGDYSSDDFQRLRRDLLSNQQLTQWHPLLGQCFDAYGRGQYIITVPALISIIEGFLAYSGQVSTSKWRDVKGFIEDTIRNSDEGSLKHIIWTATLKYLDNLFGFSDFAQSPPEKINRHWILHGRDAADWAQADALRLIIALYTISTLLKSYS